MSSRPELSEIQFGILQHAVTLGRSGMCPRLPDLKDRLKMHGYEDADIEAAIKFWANHMQESKVEDLAE